MFDVSFLAIQALGLVPSIVCFTSLQSGSRLRILRLQMVCSVLWACHYGLLGAYTAVLTNGVGLFRAVLCYHNDKPWAKSRGWVALLLGLYAGCAMLTWDGLYCLLPCLSMACTTLALWTHNMPRTRLLFLLNSPPLLAYNLITGAYSCALVEVCALISFAVAIYRFDLRGKKARLPQR